MPTPTTGELDLGSQLTPMRRLWIGIEHDLRAMDISSLEELKGKDPQALTAAYCAHARRPFDDVIQDVFTALIRFAEDGVPRAWWEFTRQRLRTAAQQPL